MAEILPGDVYTPEVLEESRPQLRRVLKEVDPGGTVKSSQTSSSCCCTSRRLRRAPHAIGGAGGFAQGEWWRRRGGQRDAGSG